MRTQKKIARALTTALLAASVLIGCAAGLALPTPQQLVEIGAVPGGADLAALRRGRALMVTQCGECHRPCWPREHSPTAWKPIARKMGRLASMSTKQIADLELYLVTASKATRAPAATSPGTRGPQ